MNDNNTKTIQLAAGKGRTVWLQNWLIELLPQLNLPSTDYQTWFDSLKSVMEHRGLTQPIQQKDYLSDVHNAIRVLDPNHPALEIVDKVRNQPSNSSNSATTNSMVIPYELQSKLSTIADLLGITPDQTIQALFAWTEMGLSLALQLEVEDLDPQAVFESVENLQARASNNLSSSDFDFNLSETTTLDSHSINQLSTSIRILSQTLSQKQTSQSDRQSSQNAPISQPSSPKSKSKRKLSKVSIEAELEVNRAIDAIIEFNNTENLAHNDKWHIGVGILRKLTERGDTVIKRILERRTDQIQQHHAQHQISQGQNSRGRNYPSIDEVISLDSSAIPSPELVNEPID